VRLELATPKQKKGRYKIEHFCGIENSIRKGKTRNETRLHCYVLHSRIVHNRPKCTMQCRCHIVIYTAARVATCEATNKHVIVCSCYIAVAILKLSCRTWSTTCRVQYPLHDLEDSLRTFDDSTIEIFLVGRPSDSKNAFPPADTVSTTYDQRLCRLVKAVDHEHLSPPVVGYASTEEA